MVIVQLINKVYWALKQAESNGYSQWDNDVDQIVMDLMTYSSEFEELDEEDVKEAVIGALEKYKEE